MHVMAFAFSKEQVRILEHNDRFYWHYPETHLLRLCYELTAQLDYLFTEREERERFRVRKPDRYEQAWRDEENRAYWQIAVMHEQASQAHRRLSMATLVRQTKGA